MHENTHTQAHTPICTHTLSYEETHILTHINKHIHTHSCKNRYTQINNYIPPDVQRFNNQITPTDTTIIFKTQRKKQK